MGLFQIVVKVAVLILTIVSSARAETLITQMEQGVANPIKIAIVPFQVKSTRAFDVDLAQLIESNLERTGQFSRVRRETMLAQPGPSDQIFYRDWRAIGSEYTVVGSVERDSQGLLVRYGLHDVFGERILFAERIPGTPDALRDIGHYVSDRIYESLTGIKGIFSTRLLYVSAERRSETDQTFKLILSDADGGRPRTIFQSSDPILSPTWSPDGSRVAYMAFRGKRAGIYLQTVATGEVQKVSDFPGLNSAPKFSPDSNNLALTLSKDGNPEVYIANLRTGTLNRLTNHPSIDVVNDWSPDNKNLLITSTREGTPQLYEVNIQTKNIQKVPLKGSYNSSGSYLPNSSGIVYMSESNSGLELRRWNSNNDSIVTLTSGIPILDEKPTIAPNGTFVLYTAFDGGRSLLGFTSLDGRVKFRMPSVSNSVSQPAWSPFFW